jgi:hypothetical protein
LTMAWLIRERSIVKGYQAGVVAVFCHENMVATTPKEASASAG